jgi:hypothetical protein
MSGTISASAAAAAGLETSGSESAVTLAAAWALVSGAEVSGSVALTLTVLGAVTTGSALPAPATAAGGFGAELFGGVVEALAPEGLAEACVLAPLAGLDTRTLAGADPVGLLATETEAGVVELLTVAVVGAFTDAGALTDGGLTAAGGDAGGTCASAGCATATHNNTVSDVHSDRFANCCIRSTSRGRWMPPGCTPYAAGCHA